MRIVALLAFVATLIFPAVAAAADFTVTPQGMTAWVINGTANPPLTLTQGHTYTFDVNATGHPFFIKTAQVTGSGSTFDTGVTNNGVQVGTLTFTVPQSAPPTLFYQCGVHAAMTGPITIQAASGVPATGPVGVALLALILGAFGFVAYRRLARARELAS